MNEERVDEICDRCKEPINILVSEFERAMKAGEPILCPDCYSEYLDEETEELPPNRCFEYKIEELGGIQHLAVLNKAGSEGWELVSVDDGKAYFKRNNL